MLWRDDGCCAAGGAGCCSNGATPVDDEVGSEVGYDMIDAVAVVDNVKLWIELSPWLCSEEIWCLCRA